MNTSKADFVVELILIWGGKKTASNKAYFVQLDQVISVSSRKILSHLLFKSVNNLLKIWTQLETH